MYTDTADIDKPDRHLAVIATTQGYAAIDKIAPGLPRCVGGMHDRELDALASALIGFGRDEQPVGRQLLPGRGANEIQMRQPLLRMLIGISPAMPFLESYTGARRVNIQNRVSAAQVLPFVFA
ncbi:MAG: hypothetical protein RLY71_3666 [Pseudomonadota bacterium]